VLIRCGLLFILLAGIAPLWAQDEPIHMKPEFPLIFPLAQNGRDVSVKFPVLISPTTILKPGMVLRTIYILSHDTDAVSDLVLAHKGDAAKAYSREPNSAALQIPSDIAHEIEGYRRTVWEVSNNFVLAMAQYPTDTMHLIYSPTGKNQDLEDARFSFFDGLFVGLPNGRLTVLAVERDSKAEAAGLKAGDEIVSVGGIPTQDNLFTFASAYSAAKKAAKDNEVSTYAMTIHPQGKADTQQVNVAMPPRITGGLMNGF
jgi:hypothetical protein